MLEFFIVIGWTGLYISSLPIMYYWGPCELSLISSIRRLAGKLFMSSTVINAFFLAALPPTALLPSRLPSLTAQFPLLLRLIPSSSSSTLAVSSTQLNAELTLTTVLLLLVTVLMPPRESTTLLETHGVPAGEWRATLTLPSRTVAQASAVSRWNQSTPTSDQLRSFSISFWWPNDH